jgi:hypothetical protein
VPLEAKGSRYAVLFLENMLGGPREDFSDAVGINLAVRFATLFYVQIEGGLERKADLENFDLKKAGPYAPLLINADFKNTGNADIIAAGIFAVIDKKGRVKARGKFDNFYTLPGDSIKIKGICRNFVNKGDGLYNLVITLALDNAEYRLFPHQRVFLVKELEMALASDGSLLNFKALD